jgi:Flp pilus assembly protein TadG
MNTKHLNSEKGQAIVYLALGLVVFLGFVALAIDGGMVLADRRDAQNATDASALAGAARAAQYLGGAKVDPKNVDHNCNYDQLWDAKEAAITAAEDRAESNHYPDVKNNDENNYVHVSCGVSSGPYMDVGVGISKNTPTSFLQVLVPNANLTNKMTSTARLHTAHEIGGKYTLVALGLIDNSIVVGGDANLRIIGGGVFGNAGAKCDGSAPKDPFLIVCKEGTKVEDCIYNSSTILPGSVDIVGTDNCKGQIQPDPNINATALDPALFELQAPDCSGHNYGTGYDPVPLSANMAAGLYCVHGDLDFPKNATTHAHGVTFYLVDGGITINASDSTHVELESPMVTDAGENGAIPGLLFFAPLSNTSSIKKDGTADGYFHGTWVLPGMNLTTPGWKGTFLGDFRGQMIINNINMAGTFDGGMFYDAPWIYTVPASIDLLH